MKTSPDLAYFKIVGREQPKECPAWAAEAKVLRITWPSAEYTQIVYPLPVEVWRL